MSLFWLFWQDWPYTDRTGPIPTGLAQYRHHQGPLCRTPGTSLSDTRDLCRTPKTRKVVKIRKFTKIQSKPGNALKTRQNQGYWWPGPVPRCTTGVRTTTPYPYHGYHPPIGRVSPLHRVLTPVVSEPGTRSPGFFSIQWPGQNSKMSKIHCFYWPKTDLPKLTFLTKKPT